MKHTTITRTIVTNNKGIDAERDYTLSFGLPYAKHDNNNYDFRSDIELPGRHISVKAYHFTLCSGTLCEGETTLEGIWNVYARHTPSNEFAYVMGCDVYTMDIDEFKAFIFLFGSVERDSSGKNGGCFKIRAKRCENKMKAWFESHMEQAA